MRIRGGWVHRSRFGRTVLYARRLESGFAESEQCVCVTVRESLRALLGGDPGPYERAWLTSINTVGVVVVVGVVFDSSILLGSGQSGIFQRALYPLAPPAATLGVALAIERPRGVVLSTGLLIGYLALLTVTGTVQDALAAAPGYAGAAVVGVVAVATLGYGVTEIFTGVREPLS